MVQPGYKILCLNMPAQTDTCPIGKQSTCSIHAMTNCEQWKGESHRVDMNYAVKLDKYLESLWAIRIRDLLNDRTPGLAAL
jgi:hypothetical protein